MKLVLVVVAVAMVVEGARAEQKKGGSNNDDKKSLKIPKEFLQWDRFNKRFLHHINIHPSKLKENEIKPHLYTLLKKLDFLTLVEDYLNKKLGNVRTEEQARRVFTLLDLLSAQEPLRMRYLKQMREALVSLFERHPNAAKHTIPSHFILGAFDRHVKARKRRAMAVLRRVMVGSPETITTLVHYKAGRYSALDHTLRRHAIANPFMEVSDKQWYHIKPATSPHLTLSIDLLTWRMLLVNHTFSPTLFRFKAVSEKRQQIYSVRSAVLSSSASLSYPCHHHHHHLCFSYEDSVSVELVTLQRGEVALTSKGRNGTVLYLRDATGGREAAFPRVPVPTMTPQYPGRPAHWILSPLKRER
ncbi:uncharacterized protein LOC123504274 [Portunus trituberculatus]|uniref:uncharacterized protein LOC123504274 n=1 Tax=Portunus trituberculatus TaxID=210409 RepID=UPI001E1D1A18|nr:uncharacterized protein LOC123504274 [Portunus trituberculatus]XP_045110634.1 uncharacterized protein LOC123504274 [Portunus trituberculatus]XP_045110642.1 uncharacterized protein LOC123504274 [Portunus trituberculatus]